jgi:hypothetical protein
MEMNHTITYPARASSAQPERHAPPTRTEPAVGAAPRAREGAYEIKFLLPEAAVETVARWARDNLLPDPHAGPDGTYGVRSLYLDTDALDVYRGSQGFRSSKYRVRRYGSEALLYLEKKTKNATWVSKQRTAVAAPELALLCGGACAGDWPGLWFRAELRKLALAPRLQVGYRRLACAGEAGGVPVRLTLDREVRCAPATWPSLDQECDESWSEGGTVLEGAVLELKFPHVLPRLFKELIRELALRPADASKYRRAVERCGLAALPVKA